MYTLLKFDSLTEAKQAVLDLIDQNVTLEELYEEIQNNSDLSHLCCDDPVLLTKSSCGEYIRRFAALSGLDYYQSSRTILMQHLHAITASEFTTFLNSEQQDFINSLLEATKSSFLGHCSAHGIDRFEHCLPLDVICALTKYGILDLESYLKMLVQQKHVLKELVHGLVQCTSLGESSMLDKASEITCQLMRMACQPSSQAMQKVCQYILHSTFKCVLDQQAGLKATVSSSPEGLSIFDKVCGSVQPNVLKTYFSQLVAFWATNDPVFCVSDAVKQQLMWTSSKLPKLFVKTHKQILTSIELETAMGIIQKALSKRQVNWKHVLSLISCLLLTFEDAPRNVDDLVKCEIRKGLEKSATDNLVIGLLFVRQATLEGSHIFPSYTSWFQENFTCGAKSLLRSPPEFRFFIKLLSDLVPCEHYQFLKVHVMKPPHPPNQACREVLSDYLALARTRLVDLKPDPSETVKVSSDQSQEVDKMVAVFEKTARIPSSLMEMSIFRKTQYHDKFLPALLQPRPLPDVPDPKMKLISTLLSMGKIPSSAYTKYQEQCKAESEKLLQDVMEVDAADGFETFDARLEKLRSNVRTLWTKPHTQREILQEVHRSLCDLISNDCVTVDDEAIDLNIPYVVDSTNEKVVHCIVEALSETPPLPANQSPLKKLLRVIGNQPQAKEALCRKIHRFVTLETRNRTSLLDVVISNVTITGSASSFVRIAEFHCHCVDAISQLASSLPDPPPQAFHVINQNIRFALLRFQKALDEDCQTAKRLKTADQTNETIGPERIRSLAQRLDSACHHLKSVLNTDRREQTSIKQFVLREVRMTSCTDIIDHSGKNSLYDDVLLNDEIDVCDLDDVTDFFFDNCDLLNASNEMSPAIVDYFCNNLSLLLSGRHCGQWLVAFLAARKTKLEQKFRGITLETELHRLATTSVDFLLRLPPHFMYDDTDVSISSEDPDRTRRLLEPLLSFSNICLRDLFWCQLDIRSLPATALLIDHVLRGVAEKFQGAFDLSVLSYIANNIPVVFMCLLNYWPSMKQFRFITKVRCRRLHQSLCQLRSIVTCNVSGDWERGLRELKLVGSNPWLALATCMALHADEASDAALVSSCLASLSRIQPKIRWLFLRSSIICCAARCASQDQGRSGGTPPSVFADVLTTLPSVDVMACLAEMNSEDDLFPEALLKRSGLSAIRLLSISKCSREILNEKDFLPFVVRLQQNSRTEATDADLTIWHNFLHGICRLTSTNSLRQTVQLLRHKEVNPGDATVGILTAEISRREK